MSRLCNPARPLFTDHGLEISLRPTRVVVPIDSQDPEAWNCALAYALKIGGEVNRSLRPPRKHCIQGTAGHQTVRLLDRGELIHETLQTLRLSGRGAVIIAYFADDKLLQTIDGLDVVAGIVAVPDLPNNAEKWIACWNPVVHGQPRTDTPAPLINDHAIVNGLTALSNLVNVSHGAMIPRDEEHADEHSRFSVLKDTIWSRSRSSPGRSGTSGSREPRTNSQSSPPASGISLKRLSCKATTTQTENTRDGTGSG